MVHKNWKEENNLLQREFTFKDFKEAMDFVNNVADVAEEVQHHPDIFIHDYKNVKISLTSHDAGKVTDKDHDMAERIDKTQSCH